MKEMTKKTIALILLITWNSLFSFGQLTGTKTIPGDYSSVAAAISALNTTGVGTGGVAFNIAAGYTETFPSLTSGLITATGTATNPVIFKKTGTGANPVISGSSSGPGTTDYIFCLKGSDYITFDGIDVNDPNGAIEWGYAVLKASAINGSQYVTIKNCSILLTKTNMATYGIYSANITPEMPGFPLTITSSLGTNSNNKFFSNNFFNCYSCIYLYGFGNDVSPFYDQSNEIGVDGGNTFTNFGGGTNTAYGIFGAYQDNLKIANNSWSGSIANSTGSVLCLYLQNQANNNLDIYNNTISVDYEGTGSFYGLCSLMGASGTTNTTNIYGNTVSSCTFPNATSGAFYGMYVYGGKTSNFYNNQVTNNTYGSATATATGEIYGIYHYCISVTAGIVNVHGNTVANNSRIQSVIGTGTGYYFQLSGNNGVLNAYNNIVDNLTVGSLSTQYIGYINYNGTKNVYNNSFTNILNINGGTIYGLYNTGGTGDCRFYNNKIRNLNGLGAGSVVYGIYHGSGNSNTYYYNNYISELKTPFALGNPAICGVKISAGTTIGIYNNSIYLDAASAGSTFGVTGIYASVTPNVELRNNIVVNNSTPAGTGRVVAYERSSDTPLSTYINTSDNNNFWAGPPGVHNLLYYDGTNSDQTLAAYKSRVSPCDGSSVSENPPFVNVSVVPYDLHLQTTMATQCEGAGSVVATPVSITTDFDASPRYPNTGYPVNSLYPPNAPDIGADEFGGIPLDLTPPRIMFIPLSNTSSLTSRTLISTITDATGVPTNGAGLPRLFWRINSGTWNTSTGTWMTGNTYTFTLGAGVAINDVVSYYIVAQDIVTPIPNVGSNPNRGAGGFTVNPPACSTQPTSPFTYTIVGTLTGVYPVGAGKVYPTITAAVADLNHKEVVGPVTFELWDNQYSSGETFPVIINQFITSNPSHTVTIKPKSGVTTLISGAAEGILKLNGCDNVIIDGSSSGGTDKSLTWENSYNASTAYTIGFFNNNGDASSNCTLRNCFVKANTTNIYVFTYAVTLDGTGGGSNNIVISNNVLLNARYGLHIAGVSDNPATNVHVVNNMIGSAIDADAIDAWGIDITHADNTLIQGNEIMGAIGGGNPGQAGIYISSGSTNTKIRNNKIHDWYYNGTTHWGCWGIFYNAEASSTTEISNNLIYNIKSDGYISGVNSDNPYGIYIQAGGNLQIYHNTIYLSGNVLSSNTAVWSACIGINSGCSSIDIRNNILKNSMQPVSGNLPSKTFAVINGNPAGIFTNINNNDYYVDGIGPNIGFQDQIRPTLAAWQTATGQDNASVNIDPLFTSETNLIPTSVPLIHKGVYLPAVPNDITNISRSNPPDVGAYEYATDPIVNTTAATGITSFAATLNGTIQADNLSVNSSFEYGLTTAYGSIITGTPATVNGTTVTPISAAISGLTPATLYHFRARGTVTPGGVIAFGPDLTFSTGGPPPTVVTTPATFITATQATLNGTVNANNLSTAVIFQYGLTTTYGSTVAGLPATVTGNVVTMATGTITGLIPNTLYHYRIVGTSAAGASEGMDLTFITGPGSPIVVTNPASNITATGAQLNGLVSANSASAAISFEWGLTTAYGNVVAGTPAAVSGNAAVPALASLTGLLNTTTYHYRCVAVNSVGTVYGLDQSFVTGCPSPAPAGPITGPVAVCAFSSGNVYSVGTIVNALSYTWTLPSGAIITAGAGTNIITVTFGSNSGNVTVAGTGTCGTGTASSLSVTVNPQPVPAITGPASTCVNSTGNVYSTQAGMTGYTWAVSAGGTITAGAGTSVIMVTWSTLGAKSVTVNYSNAFGCAASVPSSYAVTVNALPTPTITGTANVCEGASGLVYITEAGMANYIWTVSAGGTITAGGTSTSNTVTVTWTTAGPKVVTVNYTNTSNCSASVPASFAVNVNPTPVPTIGSTNNPCLGSTNNNYYTEGGMSGYVWTVSSGGTIVSGQGTAVLNVTWNQIGPQTVSVTYTNTTGCPAMVPGVYSVFVNSPPNAAGAISGTASVCAGTNGVIYSTAPVAGATSYTWTVPSGSSIASGSGTSSIVVNFSPAAVSGNVTVAGTNQCGSGTASSFAVAVNPMPAAAGMITGPSTVCTGSTGVEFSVATIANANSYVWTVPAGATITSGATSQTIVVTFGPAAGSGNITVMGTNSCGNGTVSPNFNVTMNATPDAPVVTSVGNVLMSSAATGNQWYYEGTPIPGATSQSYTVINNTGYYWCVVTVNGCSSPISNKVWLVVTGQQELQNSAISVYPVPNAGLFTISFESASLGSFTISIYNNLGVNIYEMKDIRVNGHFEQVVALEHAVSGTYTIIIRNPDNLIVKKMIVLD